MQHTISSLRLLWVLHGACFYIPILECIQRLSLLDPRVWFMYKEGASEASSFLVYCIISMHALIQHPAFCTLVLSLMLGMHAHEGYCSQFVCVCVCYQSSASLWRACDKLNLPAWYSPNSKGFQLADFAKTFSIPSYGLFFAFAQPKVAICNHWSCHVASLIDDHYLRAVRVRKRSSA